MKNKKIISLYHHIAPLVLCTAVFTLNPMNSAQAQEWRLEPILKAGVVTDDNAKLDTRTDNEVELTGYLLDAKVDINYLSDTTSFFVQPRALIRTYPGDSEFDSDDFFLRSQLRHRGKLSTFGFRFNFDQQSVRTGERTDSDLEIEDPDEIPDDDTGRVRLKGDRSRLRLSPFWDYRLSNISSIGVGLDYSNTYYDEVFAGLLDDFTDVRIKLNYRRSFSEKTSGILTLTGRRFDSDGSSNNQTGYSVLAGFEHALTEKTRVAANIGVENTDQNVGQSEASFVGDITLRRDLETIRMFARYQRTVSGSGAGTVEVRDTVNMNFNRRLSERIAAGLGVRAYRTERVGGGASSVDDRKYVQLQAKFIWYLSTAFVIEADYRYTILDRSNALGERSNSNEVGLWFVYQPNTIPTL